MDWIKIPTDNILYSEFKDSELITLIKYQALFCQLENEPSLYQLKRIFNQKQIKFIQCYSRVVQELCKNQINSVKTKRNRDKESYIKKQSLTKNSDSGKLSNRELSGGADKIREDKIIIKEIYKEKFEEFWKRFPKQRAGSKEKAFTAYVKAIKDKRATVEKMQEAVEKYACSDEVGRGFAKGCAAWLNDDRFNTDYGDGGVF